MPALIHVTVTDDNGCTAQMFIRLTNQHYLYLATSQTDANCSQADGEACVTPTGGTAGYTYLWDDPAGTNNVMC